MNRILVACCLSAALLAGCEQPKSPQAAATDVATARQDAARQVADAKRDAAKDVNDADKALQEKSAALANANAQGNYEVAMAKADGDHKVAIEACGAKAGDQQRACKQLADANYDAAKANAKATKVGNSTP